MTHAGILPTGEMRVVIIATDCCALGMNRQQGDVRRRTSSDFVVGEEYEQHSLISMPSSPTDDE
jgi:hypothetical protein